MVWLFTHFEFVFYFVEVEARCGVYNVQIIRFLLRIIPEFPLQCWKSIWQFCFLGRLGEEEKESPSDCRINTFHSTEQDLYLILFLNCFTESLVNYWFNTLCTLLYIRDCRPKCFLLCCDTIWKRSWIFPNYSTGSAVKHLLYLLFLSEL